jgi:hypothetical protein
MKTRLQQLLEGKNVLKNSLRENKIKRGIESAIDNAEEQILSNQEKALELLDILAETDKLEDVLNKYIEAKSLEKQYSEAKKYLEGLKEYLNEKTKVEDVK